VVVSTGLVGALGGAELRAVLAHEQAHLRRRDPLRVLLARVLVAHLWFLPMAGDLRRRARHGYELAADRDAADRYGRSALAGALLRVVSPPMGVEAAAVTRFADPALLESRVSQLESGRPPGPAPVAAGRALLTVAGALAFVAVVAGGWSFMLVACSSGVLG
jgi:beta-lactamase regulating signal transducer with metallopeptidase domain